MNAETLLSALPEALAAVSTATKDSTNPHFKSRYADLASVITAIRPAAEKGVWFRQVSHPTDRQGVEIETFYVGHGAELSAGVFFVPVQKGDAQAFGSAMTYARRYALSLAFGVAADDDDGNAASQAAPAITLASDADIVKIQQLCKAVGDNAVGKILTARKIKNLNQLEARHAVRVIEQLENALAERVEEHAEAAPERETVDA